MLDVQVTIPNEGKWRAAVADLAKGVYFKKPRRETLEGAGILIAEEARRRVPRAFGTLERAIDWKMDGEDAVRVGILRNDSGPSGRIGTQEYGYYVENGTGGGSMPPPGVLRPWMARVGFTGSEFVLRRKIAERGLRPQPFLGPALEAKRDVIVRQAASRYQEALNAFANRVGGGILGRIGAFFRGLFG